jgi:hypothetical protein
MNLTNPVPDLCFSYVGDGLGYGALHRVILSDALEVVTVHESNYPRWSWLGTPDEFRRVFRFIAGPAASYDRGIGKIH